MRNKFDESLVKLEKQAEIEKARQISIKEEKTGTFPSVKEMVGVMLYTANNRLTGMNVFFSIAKKIYQIF